MGESKYDVLRLVPEEVKPKTVLIKLPSSREQVLAQMKEAGLTFPVIFKPDLGERGWLVNRIDQEQDVDNYLTKIPVDFIIQELVDLPLEFGVYYIRLPNEERGVVTSITAKEFLRVEGDGCKTLAQLIWEKDRAKLQWHVLKRKFAHQWDRVIPASEKVELVSIGNHCLGTMFLNGNHLITPKLNSSFDALSKPVDGLGGLHFGRRWRWRGAPCDRKERSLQHAQELTGITLAGARQRRKQCMQVYFDRRGRLPVHVAQLSPGRDPNPSDSA